MALIDEYTFFATAGRGGDGVVHWHREKFKPKGGPDGGDGGRGGHFYIEAVRDITILKKIVRKNNFKAEDGKLGEGNLRHGADGKNYILELPVGSLVTNLANNKTIELITEGERVRLLEGGKGGFGNEHFKSSTNQTPKQATKGKDGESGNFKVELRLIADIGLIGLPNAGKTSLLNALTNAGARVAEYPFTTLDPNLGVYHGYIIADIPGLIEGASIGKGLGHKFLRHITRTDVILHCISLERDDLISDYNIVRNELDAYSNLKEKREYIVLTKKDVISENKLEKIIENIKKVLKRDVLCVVSILDDNSIKQFADSMIVVLKR